MMVRMYNAAIDDPSGSTPVVVRHSTSADDATTILCAGARKRVERLKGVFPYTHTKVRGNVVELSLALLAKHSPWRICQLLTNAASDAAARSLIATVHHHHIVNCPTEDLERILPRHYLAANWAGTGKCCLAHSNWPNEPRQVCNT